jgi:dipeptide/tripeptide permease
MLGLVFAMFYFCINAGSLASTIVTPLLREYTTVRRHTSSLTPPATRPSNANACLMTFTQYYIAFGVPAALLTFATLVFWAGLPTYRIVRSTSSLSFYCM